MDKPKNPPDRVGIFHRTENRLADRPVVHRPVEGDPLADINVAINNVRWVMKGGAVVVDKTKAQPH